MSGVKSPMTMCRASGDGEAMKFGARSFGDWNSTLRLIGCLRYQGV